LDSAFKCRAFLHLDAVCFWVRARVFLGG